jgi:DNA adenine methylase
MKTPITYYGGKQSMLKHILPLIPPHKTYVEPFVGGGAVYWAKQTAEIEVINDTNSEVVNFYQAVQKNYEPLEKEITGTLHSRDQFRQAKIIYENPDMFDTTKRAWAFWVLSCQSYSSSLGSGWRHAKSIKIMQTFNMRREKLLAPIVKRLESTQIECADALKVIGTYDDTDTFFYVDPPYYNANMGHYAGYTLQDFNNLLNKLAQVKGKFLLSSYPSEMLSEYSRRHGWKTILVKRKLGMKREGERNKTEVLTANYEIAMQQEVISS